MDKITVITPVYNTKEEFLKKSLNSVLEQSYENIEYIIVDDGSNDYTRYLLSIFSREWKKQRGNSITVLHQDNKGLTASLNTAVPHITGDYVFFVDSDDILSRFALEILHKIIAETNTGMVIGSYTRNESAIAAGNSKFGKPKIYSDIDALMILCHFPRMLSPIENSSYIFRPRWNKLYRRSVLDNVVFPVGRIGEDQATNYKLICNAKTIAYSQKITYFYRPNGALTNTGCLRNGHIITTLEEKLQYFEDKFGIGHLEYKTDLDDLKHLDAKKHIIYNETILWYENALARVLEETNDTSYLEKLNIVREIIQNEGV